MTLGGTESVEGTGGGEPLGMLSDADVGRVVNRLSDGIVVLDRNLRYRYLNDPAAEMLGRTVEHLLGKHIWTEFPEAMGLPVHLAIDEALADRNAMTVVEHYEPLRTWFENRIFPLDDDELFIVFRDVSAAEQAREDLREQARRLADAERIMKFGVWSMDLASKKVRWSEQLERIHGLQPGQFPGTAEASEGFGHVDDRDRVREAMEKAVRDRRPFVFTERIIRADGIERLILTEGHALTGPDGEVRSLVGVCHDVTDHAATEQALGASERRMRAIVDNTPSVITVKDLDGRYVMTNAESGRVLGISPDALIGKRYEDFLSEETAAKRHAEDALAATEREPVYSEHEMLVNGDLRTFMTVTFALPDETGLPFEVCSISTDVTDSREREVERLERVAWGNTIDSAIAEDRMRVFAQPIVDLRTGTRKSNELLVRMVTAGEPSEVLSPAAFLPAAERFGLIQRIDAWMVRQALERTNGSISEVNLSAVTLCDRAARTEIVDLLASAGERATRIIFEITETAVAEHLDAASEFAEDVTNLGCQLALDDFGTGFGSLTYLNNLPLSFIKIDMSFVRALAATPVDDRLVKSIIEIAGVFNLKTIAEGIEDSRTLELLRELGVDYAQGFHLGRPAPLPQAVIR